MATKPGEANFFPDVPVYPEMGTFQPVYGKFDLTTYIQGASDYEIMAFLVGKYNACLEAYDKVTKLSTDTITAAHQLQDWINTWFDNLDVQQELNNKIDSMVADGSFGELLHQTFDAQINKQTTNAVTAWLVANVTPTGSAVVVDKSLSIEGAAADAKVTGDTLTELNDNLFLTTGMPFPVIGIGCASTDATNEHFSLFNDSNFKSVRTSILWEQVEKAPSTYDFSYYDNIIDGIISNGMTPFIIISCLTPVTFYGNTKAPLTTTQRTAFNNFLIATFAHYSKKHIIYEFWNEPNSPSNWEGTMADYAVSATSFCNLVHQYDYTGLACVGAMYYGREMFDAIKNGCALHADYYSVHLYLPANVETNENNILQRVRATLSTYGRQTLPIIISETGYSTVPDWDGKGNAAVADDNTRADYLSKIIIQSIQYNVSHIFIYTSFTSQASDSSSEDWFGIFNNDSSLTITASAIKDLCNKLNNSIYIGKYTGEQPDYLYAFKNNQSIIVFYWTTRLNHTFSLFNTLITITSTLSSSNFDNEYSSIKNFSVENPVLSALLYTNPFIYQYPNSVALWPSANNIANGSFSFCGGSYNNANANFSCVFGTSNTATKQGQFVCGTHNEQDDDARFIIGNGSSGNPSNSLCVYDYKIKILNEVFTSEDLIKLKQLLK